MVALHQVTVVQVDPPPGLPEPDDPVSVVLVVLLQPLCSLLRELHHDGKVALVQAQRSGGTNFTMLYASTKVGFFLACSDVFLQRVLNAVGIQLNI